MMNPPTLLTAVLILPLAIILDGAGLLLAIFGVTEIFSYITDAIGIIFIGGWTLMLSQSAKITYGAEKNLTRATKWIKRMRWLRPLLIILEFIPFVGAAPCWTILILIEMKNSSYSNAEA